MLLYTRVAQPKVPKKRSRAGCNFCKEKKKKCDEARPQCARCVENQQECVYEPIKPRQRRRREPSIAVSEALSKGTGMSIYEWEQAQQVDLTNDAQWNDGLSMGDDAARSIPGDMDQIVPWTPGTVFTPMTPMTTASFDMPSITATQDNQDDIEEIVRQDYFTSVGSYSDTNNFALSPRSPSSNTNQFRFDVPSPYFEFCSPAFAEFSSQKNRRHLVDHFCNTLSHLIVFREENGNPFQQLVLPLSKRSPAVMDSIYALSSAHLEFRGVENEEKSEFFHGRAVQKLARLIENGGGENKNELLAAIMLLVYYEVLVQKGRSNIVDGHLKGAMTILNDQQASTDPTGVFLERAFRFYDVIAALSFGTAPLSSAPGRGSFSTLPPLDSRGATSPVGSVDTLLGMATTLWPVIHRLSNLVGVKDELDLAMSNGQVNKAAVMRTELEITASAIQVALNEWEPTLPEDANRTPAEEARLKSILNNALAYRHSAFVYLYRTIYGHARSHKLIQHHAHLSLTHCVGTVSGEGPMSALLWPLFVAACEAMTDEDKDLATQSFAAIDRVQGMANIEKAWCIVQEVWRRAEDAEEEAYEREREARERQIQQSMKSKSKTGGDLWRRVSREMGVNIVFG